MTYGLSATVQLGAPGFWGDPIEMRVREIQRKLRELCNPFLVPSFALLTAICTLDPSSIDTISDYRWQRVAKGVQVAFFAKDIEAIISVKKIGQSHKSAWQAFRVYIPKDTRLSLQIQQVFRSTQKFNNHAICEVKIRSDCNNLRNFPKLLAHGSCLGRKKKRECKKMMMVEEYHAQNLKQYIESSPSILHTVSEVVAMLCSLLESLEDLHKTHVHSDLKADNLLVEKGKLLLTDLGIAENLDSGVEFIHVTNYMSPEIFGESSYDDEGWFQMKSSYDMWGFALIAYRLLHRVIGMEKTPDFSSWQNRLCLHFSNEKTVLYDTDYLRFTQSVELFTKRLEMNVHPLAKWLATMFKLNPAERITASQALSSLKNSPYA
jgi:serine/threonine protein kinase